MIEIVGDMWEVQADARCITTNGSINTKKQCVMGRGTALQASKRYPRLPKELGSAIIGFGNNVHYFMEYKLFSFPVKHDWWEMADLELIQRSYKQLIALLDAYPHISKVLLPKPGVWNGRLDWEEEVKPLLLSLPQDDRVTIISNE